MKKHIDKVKKRAESIQEIQKVN